MIGIVYAASAAATGTKHLAVVMPGCVRICSDCDCRWSTEETTCWACGSETYTEMSVTKSLSGMASPMTSRRATEGMP